jgi:hypothetical protein
MRSMGRVRGRPTLPGLYIISPCLRSRPLT